MKNVIYKYFYQGITVIIAIIFIVFSTAFHRNENIKIAFLLHDMVSERWKLDVDYFSNKVQELGGEVIVKNAFGDADSQIKQGKLLIDEGVKVLVVVAQDGNSLTDLVDYADEKGAKIIAYDRMINNCNLHYYISYNSIKVGELMAEYAVKLKPKGNFVLLYGPSSDNNALLVKQGIHNVLKKKSEEMTFKIIMEQEFDTWYGLDTYIRMEEFLSETKLPVDVIIASNDDQASGVVDALKQLENQTPIVTGQDASIEACKNILEGYQTMTVYKSIQKLSKEAAILSMKVAANQRVEASTTINNGKYNVPSILFDPVKIDRFNLKEVLFADKHIKESDLK